MRCPRKALVIFGTRPEAIKMAPVVAALRTQGEFFDTRVVVTGQHREQLDQALRHFDIRPDYDLNIMQPQQSLAYIVTAALTGLEEILETENPDLVLVHGDTHTTMAASLAAFYHRVELVHVEAGLRTGNKYSPFPEEINRRVTDVVADILLAPTPLNRQNLLDEGMPRDRIFVTGQTGVDAAVATYRNRYVFADQRLNQVEFGGCRVIAVTAHRRENWGEPMRGMFSAMRRVVDEYPDTLLIYPVHLSPAVREVAYPILKDHPRILLTDPIGYPDSINLQARSHLILSDSGGLQEEAPCFGVPLVLMRDTTERPEAVSAGVVVLAGTAEDAIYSHVVRLLSDTERYRSMARATNPFGDGRAGERAVGYLAFRYGFAPVPPEEFHP